MWTKLPSSLLSVRRISFLACSNSFRVFSDLPMVSRRLNNEHFQQLLTPELKRLGDIFQKRGYQLRLVGGVVRDLLLGNKPKDIDLATECTPEDMVKIFVQENIKYIPTGLQHGTITAHINSTDFEITTLRIDRVTDGRHAVVEFTADWMVDAERRDLTINAMSLGFDGTLYDYFDGEHHLQEKKVIFVGDPVKRIKEDYLRILRYFRFYGRIVPEAGKHDAATLEGIRSTADGLDSISAERIREEMNKIIIGNHAPHLVEVIYKLGVAKHIGLPDNLNHKELNIVWERSRQLPVHPVTMLTSLLDSVDTTWAMMMRWKYSNNETKMAKFVATHRDKAKDPNTVTEVLHYAGLGEMAAELQKWQVPLCPINGGHLKKVGIKPGPQFGRILKEITEKWKESYFTLSEEELTQAALKYKHQ
ncbi:CCA tRNA nucleotidyltransferase 1, mitochondrial-like isoform X2 [Dysidea avara]|uniref:CCA tRNA nucleotidyltransferase 1, mitochondrial-like isoform X2 n=1 Tax=Dysidea avara TaxID=196820 RepID=UPI0033279214